MNSKQAQQAYSDYQIVQNMVTELSGRENLSHSAQSFIKNASRATSTFDWEFLATISKKF